MKAGLICLFVLSMVALCMGEIAVPTSDMFDIVPGKLLEPMSPNFEALYSHIIHSLSLQKQKRNALENNLQGILSSLQSSGVLLGVLHEIAGSADEMNALASLIFQTLASLSSGNVGSGLNVTVNVTDIIQKVQDSGIISSTVNGLFLDDTQRNMFADNLGEVLVNNTWISQLLYNIGNTGSVSWEEIFRLARDTKSKDPGFNGTSYTREANRVYFKRADNNLGSYSGSFLSFINNIVGTVLQSDLVDSSLDNILAAVNGSGIVVPTIQEVLGDQSIQNMVGFISNKLYNYGVFDQIPINKYFQEAKSSGMLSKITQYAFTAKIPSNIIAQVTYRLHQKGVFVQVQRNLYGSN